MKYKLSEIMDMIGGGTPKTSNPDYWNGDIPWLSVKDFGNDYRYVYESEKHITKLGLENSSTKLLQRGDIIISARGTVGEIATIPFPMAFNQSCYGLRAKKEIVTEDFLYYLIKHSVRILKKNTHGSVFDTITRDTFETIEVDIPPISEQIKIASILGDLDSKIELNNRINNNLLEQAIALYDKMCPFSVDSDLPQGWRIGTVGEIIDIHDSKRIPLSGKERDQMENKIFPYYGAASLMDYVDNYIFDGKYLLLGEDGTVVDDKGYPILQYVWGKFWVNNHAHILTGSNGFNVESLYVLFKQTSVASIVTGAVQPKISQANLRSIKVVIPPKSTIEAYNDQVEPIFSLIRVNEDFNRSLIQVRDALLPKLMSGELDVSDVEI